MKAQEIFDTVAKHLFEQGHQAVNAAFGMCAYRSPNGSKCAVGILIPDADYDPMIEDNDVFTALEILAPNSQVCADLREHEDFLTELQEAHDWDDSWGTTETMRDALRHAANAANGAVDTSILETLSFKDR